MRPLQGRLNRGFSSMVETRAGVMNLEQMSRSVRDFLLSASIVFGCLFRDSKGRLRLQNGLTITKPCFGEKGEVAKI